MLANINNVDPDKMPYVTSDLDLHCLSTIPLNVPWGREHFLLITVLILINARTGMIHRHIDASRYGLYCYTYRYDWCHIAIFSKNRTAANRIYAEP